VTDRRIASATVFSTLDSLASFAAPIPWNE
jgi:hypothetical protein